MVAIRVIWLIRASSSLPLSTLIIRMAAHLISVIGTSLISEHSGHTLQLCSDINDVQFSCSDVFPFKCFYDCVRYRLKSSCKASYLLLSSRRKTLCGVPALQRCDIISCDLISRQQLTFILLLIIILIEAVQWRSLARLWSEFKLEAIFHNYNGKHLKVIIVWSR